MKIALASCGKLKRHEPSPARLLYQSPLFRMCRLYAETHADAWYILSAEHGLLHPETRVAPYERTLQSLGRQGREQWGVTVYQQLLETELPDRERPTFIWLAGADYQRPLAPHLTAYQHQYPLNGLAVGRRMQWLAQAIAGAAPAAVQRTPAALPPPRRAAGVALNFQALCQSGNLLGLYEYRMDRKGRVVLPAAFGDVSAVVLAMSADRQVLVFSEEAWNRQLGQIECPAAQEVFLKFFTMTARRVPIDPVTARFLIPWEMREECGLMNNQPVMVFGLKGMARVTTPDRWRAER